MSVGEGTPQASVGMQDAVREPRIAPTSDSGQFAVSRR